MHMVNWDSLYRFTDTGELGFKQREIWGLSSLENKYVSSCKVRISYDTTIECGMGKGNVV